MTNGGGKSDSAIVAVKLTNKAEQSAAESVEPRAEAKGTQPCTTVSTGQGRVDVCQMPGPWRGESGIDRQRARGRLLQTCQIRRARPVGGWRPATSCRTAYAAWHESNSLVVSPHHDDGRSPKSLPGYAYALRPDANDIRSCIADSAKAARATQSSRFYRSVRAPVCRLSAGLHRQLRAG